MVDRRSFLKRASAMSSIRTGWVIGGAVIVLLVLISVSGRGTHYKPAGNAAATSPQTQP